MRTQPKTILILEDSRTQANIVCGLLQRSGFNTDIAYQLDDALTCLRTRSYYLILLDIFINNINSLTNLPDFRRLAPGTPIAVMTAGQRGKPLTGNIALNQARRSQVDFLLPKPFVLADIEQICEDIDREDASPVPLHRVLIIGDDTYNRVITRDMIETETVRVSESRTVEEALVRLRMTLVDTIIMDTRMPGHSRLSSLQLIKKGWPHVPIISVVDELRIGQSAHISIDVEADFEISRPLDEYVLLATLDECVRRRSTFEIYGGDDPLDILFIQ